MNTLLEYCQAGQPVDIPDGQLIFSPGDACSSFLIVCDGAVRVEQTNSAGRTVVLYRVGKGDSCVLTTTCLLSDRPYSGFGYAEGPVKAVAISHGTFRSLIQTDAAFQALVFQSFAERVGELTTVIDDLLEHRTDLRLARWLSQQTGQTLAMTQADIAQELGTAREVVSRALKAFESRGWIGLSRGNVAINDKAALNQHSRSERL